jgi:dTDP-glucose 4,6-dehydratase/UDP-glucuronate decarboxylase
VAITGAAGFLGYYLSLSLAHWNQRVPEEKQIKIVLLDTFMRGKPDWVEHCAKLNSFTVATSNVTDTPHEGLVNADYIIHAASIASPIFYREHPIETMDANVIGLRRLLDLAVEKRGSDAELKGMLFFSTSEIYGDPDADNIPTAETYRGNVSCTGPRACYDESKRFGETLCVNFAQQHNLPVTIARPFNNYGPGLKISDGRAPPDFANNILNGDDIVLLSDGTPTRTFCYIADAVIGYYKVLFHGRAGEPYNIGNDAPEVSIRDFAQLNVVIARKLFNYQGTVRFANSEDEHYLTDNPHRRCPNIAKARAELNFSPSVELETGIRNALLWYRDNSFGEKS